MTRDDKWHVIVINADGSIQAHGKFRARWAARWAIKLVLFFKVGETLRVVAPAPGRGKP